MDQENDILGFSPRVSEAAIQDAPLVAHMVCNPKKVNKPSRRSDFPEYEQYKTLSAQLLLFLTLLFSLVTSLGTIWIILRLQLMNGPNSLIIESGGVDDELIINQDLITDTLLLKDKLETEKIVASRQIVLSGSSKFLSDEKHANILMNRDFIEMQAKSFSSGSHEYEFNLPKRLSNLQVPGGMKNVKLIRAPSSIRSLSNLIDDRLKSSDLHISSSEDLELSGNLGLKVNAQEISIKAPESIYIKSRGDGIRLTSKNGLLLPIIPLALDEEMLIERNIFKFSSDDEEKEASSNYSFGTGQSIAQRYQLCIDRNDGTIFKAVKSCA